MLKDYNNLRYLLPRVKKTTVEELQVGQAMVRMVIDSPWPWPDVWTQIRVQQEPIQKSFHWQQVDGMLPVFSGQAKLKASGDNNNHCELFTEFSLDMGQAIPKFLQTWALRYYIPKVLQQLSHELTQNSKEPTGQSQL